MEVIVMDLEFPSITINHEVYVMDNEDIQLKHSGILGADFLRRHETKVNLENNHFAIKCEKVEDVVSLNLDRILLPKLSEKMISLNGTEGEMGVFEDIYEVENNVFVPPSLVENQNVW